MFKTHNAFTKIDHIIKKCKNLKKEYPDYYFKKLSNFPDNEAYIATLRDVFEENELKWEAIFNGIMLNSNKEIISKFTELLTQILPENLLSEIYINENLISEQLNAYYFRHCGSSFIESNDAHFQLSTKISGNFDE